MAKRPCVEPGCPALISGATRCVEHARQRDKERGTRQARGYDKAHDALRTSWQRRIDAGERVICWRPDCHRVITGRAWHLGHDDLDRAITHGPECVRCNLSAAGRASHGISPDGQSTGR